MNNAVLPMTFLSGIEVLGTDNQGWELDLYLGEEPERSFIKHVKFERAFQSMPLVHLGVVGFDISNHDAARLGVRVTGITTQGFDIVLNTWLGSRLWRVDVSWLAIGT